MLSRFCFAWSLLVACVAITPRGLADEGDDEKQASSKFGHSNLVAWCIVPFDNQKRTSEQRATYLEKLGIKKFAYDYRAEHIPEFDAEMEAIKHHGIELTAWWFPGSLNDEAKLILDVLKRHQLKTQLWITGGGEPTKDAADQQARVAAEAARIKPIAEAAAQLGCTVGLYNHGSWFGEPENQIEIIELLKSQSVTNVGIVYNQHHGHHHVGMVKGSGPENAEHPKGRSGFQGLTPFPELLAKMTPYLICLNLNGMTRDGEQRGHKIVPLGQGELDLELLRLVRDSEYDGPIGILNHTQEDAEKRLQDNLAGLDWLVDQLEGKPVGARPVPQTWKRPADWDQQNVAVPPSGGRQMKEIASAAPPKGGTPAEAYDESLVAAMTAKAIEGDARQGAMLFMSATSACLSCHRLGKHGGSIGPELSSIGTQQTTAQIIESVFWPQRHVKAEFAAHALLLDDGRIVRGVITREEPNQITIRDATSGNEETIASDLIQSRQSSGSLMPDGIVATWNETQRADLIAFLSDLGQHKKLSRESLDQMINTIHPSKPVEFTYQRQPLVPENWPSWELPINRGRIYDYYAKEARYFREFCQLGRLVPDYPGLDRGTDGHWGNQSEQTWTDRRWNDTVLSSLQAGVFHQDKLTIARGIALQLGDERKLFTCFDADRLNYPSIWSDKFLQFSDVRHGFMHGIVAGGPSATLPEEASRSASGAYEGFYRHGERVIFAYRIDGKRYLDSAWVEDGKFVRMAGPIDEHPLRNLISGGPAQWPQTIEVAGKLGTHRPYAIDTIPLPFDNPWKSLMFVGDHDFLSDGSVVFCTMQGDVWKGSGIDTELKSVRWRRIAAGLHHALGLVTADDQIYVLGRDQITRLHDLNNDEEIDYYECFSRACDTSTAGHDFTCGLWRDKEGCFYTASGKQGLVKISPDGKSLQVLATGLRNPDGLGLKPDGTVTAPSSEGDWVPASMVVEVPADHGDTPKYFGYGGPRGGKAPDLPLVYLPRGLDNSSGGQVYVDSDRWGPLQGQMIHTSFGTNSHFLLLRDEVDGQAQGAVVPLVGEFLSGSHRARFNPVDGQLYVSGMAGWGNYSPDDGCLQRVRYTGERVQLPISFHAHENGITLKFSEPMDRDTAQTPSRHIAQCWNYRYSGAYGSAEYSSRHLDLKGHDLLDITSAHCSDDGRELFLEIPDLQPVNQLHLLVATDSGEDHDLFLTIHRLDRPRADIPGIIARPKTVQPHPMQVDLARAARTKRNPFEKPIAAAREVVVDTGTNLSFAQRELRVKAGEPIKLILNNLDVVPHNWALVSAGAMQRVGELSNKLIADPNAVAMQYIPDTDEVLAYTDIVPPNAKFVIYFRAPETPGRYPYLCTFPGHWMVMNGDLVVEE